MIFRRYLSRVSQIGSDFFRSIHNPRQPDRKRRAAAGLALDHDVAAHHLTEAPADGEPKPGAAVFARRRGVGLRELLKQLGYLLRRHSNSRVGDRDGNPIAAIFLSLARIDRDGAALRKFYWRCS